MKKLIALLIAVLLCLGAFTACGGNGTTNVDDPENGGSLEGVTFDSRSGEMYKDTKEGKERIKISYTPGFGQGWIRQMARAFLLDEIGEGYYMVLDSDSELTTAVSSKLESGMNLSDIYFPLASNWYNYSALGYLENLDDLYNMTVPGESVTVLEKLNGAWKDYGKAICNQETHYYVFPGNENITGIVYNKTLFDEYGWEVPETVEELNTLCAKIVTDTKGTIAPFVYPGTVGGGYWDFVGTNWWLQISGTEKLDEFMKFESPDVFKTTPTSLSYGKLKSLETFEEVIVANRKTYTLTGSASKSHLLAQVSFLNRQAAMIPNGNWIEKESLAEMEDEVRMMYTPRIDGAQQDENGKYLTYNYSGQPDYMLIPAQAKNKEGAKKFLAFMCKDEILKKYTSLTGTPRPFEYDISECETSDFIKSCLDIWSNSTTWFEKSTSKLWTSNKIAKFNSGNPYTTLLANSETISAIGWCAAEYTAVEKSWAGLLEQVNGK